MKISRKLLAIVALFLLTCLVNADPRYPFGDVFAGTHTIAVIGISETPEKAGYYVPRYLKEQGFRILGVTPRGHSSIAEKTALSLKLLNEPVDMVLLFRRSEKVPEHLDDILSLEPLPKVVWMQMGIQNSIVSAQLMEKGIRVVQNRCCLVEHRRLQTVE